MISTLLFLACASPTEIKIDAPDSVRRGDSFVPKITVLDQNGQPMDVGEDVKLTLSDTKVASLQDGTVTAATTGEFEIKVTVGDSLKQTHSVHIDDPIIGQWMVEKWRFEHSYTWAPSYFDGASLVILDQKKWSKGDPKDLWYNISKFVVQVKQDRNGHMHAIWKDVSSVDVKTVQFAVWSDSALPYYADAANGSPQEIASKCLKGNAEAGADLINHIQPQARENMYVGKTFQESLGFEPSEANCARSNAWPAEVGDDITIVLAPDGKTWSASTSNGKADAKFLTYP